MRLVRFKMVKKLPKHLKDLARNIDAGKNIHGRPASDKVRRSAAKLIGADSFRSRKGKIIKLRRKKK